MVRLGWSIPQVGHLCGAVAVWVVGQGWANPASASLPSDPPPSAVIILPSKQNALATPFRRSAEASYHRTRPTESICRPFLPRWASVELAGWGRPTRDDSLPCCLLPAVLTADQPSRAACFTVRSATGFNRGVPVRCGAATRVARRSHSPRVAASSNGQPLFKGCMNTLIGGIAKFT